MLLTVIVKNDSKVTVQKKTTKSKGRNRGAEEQFQSRLKEQTKV